MTRVYTRALAIERIMARVDTLAEHACWIWPGAKGHNGYGIVTVGSKTDGSRRASRVHRVVWEHHNGPIPEGLQLDHLCNERACCNPEHLEPVTQAENLRRSAARKTHCPQGHPYAGDNLVINSNGARVCRTCSRAACRRSYRRNGRKAAA